MASRDLVTCNSLMLGYVEAGEPEVALEIFWSLGLRPDARSFLIALKACTVLAAREEGEQVGEQTIKLESLELSMKIHSQAGANMCCSDLFLVNTLVSLYAKCGSMVDSRRAFDASKRHDVISWNALVLGFAENGEEKLALELFGELVFEPTSSTLVAAVKACTSLAVKEEWQQINGQLLKPDAFRRGAQVHSRARALGHEQDLFVGSSLVDMFSKCGSLSTAREIFDRMTTRNIVSFNSLILGYSETGQPERALELFFTRVKHSCYTCFDEEPEERIPPNPLTYVGALKAAGSITSLEIIKTLHGDVCRSGFESDELVGTTLVDSYGKCGSMMNAHQGFDALVFKTSVTYNALMSGCSRQGDTEFVFQLFLEMMRLGMRVTGSSFVALLTACGHSGMVDRGVSCFGEMEKRFGVKPTLEHYHCMVDLLARGNRLDEALAMVEGMPFEATAVTWTSILSSCRKWKNLRVGSVAFDELRRLEGEDSAACLLMANVFQD